MIYQVVFKQGNWEQVDFETEDYDQACEVQRELYAEMSLMGERDFTYYIRRKR